MRWTLRPHAATCAVPVFAAMLACAPLPRVHTTTQSPVALTAAGCAGGWQLRISVKECALRTAAAALAGAALPLPFAVPMTLGLALGALFTCF